MVSRAHPSHQPKRHLDRFRRRRTEPWPQATRTNIGKDRACGSWDMIADRQTDRHTHTDTQHGIARHRSTTLRIQCERTFRSVSHFCNPICRLSFPHLLQFNVLSLISSSTVFTVRALPESRILSLYSEQRSRFLPHDMCLYLAPFRDIFTYFAKFKQITWLWRMLGMIYYACNCYPCVSISTQNLKC